MQISAPYVFDGERGIALHAMQRIRALSRGEGRFSLLFLSSGGYLGYILELWLGLSFKGCVCLVTSGLMFTYERQLRNLHEAWQGSMYTFRGEVEEKVSLSCCHSDIGIPINFQKESGNVTFRSIELRWPLEVSEGCEASCMNEEDI